MMKMTNKSPDQLLLDFAKLKEDKSSGIDKLSAIQAEVDEILTNMDKGLKILKTVGKKPEATVLKNQEKLLALKKELEIFFKARKD
jgi:hypothetical protein